MADVSTSLGVFREEAGSCQRCHDRELLHVHDDGRRAFPLFHKGTTGRARVLCVMEAPNFEDTYDPDKGCLTVEADTDPTGRFLHELLAHVGLRADDVVCTNAVLCLPAGGAGKHPVTAAIRDACRPWMERLIELMDPIVVITFGGQPLVALGRIEKHGLQLRTSAGRLHKWNGRNLLPLYHPGRLGRISRRAERQKLDIEILLSQLPASLVDLERALLGAAAALRGTPVYPDPMQWYRAQDALSAARSDRDIILANVGLVLALAEEHDRFRLFADAMMQCAKCVDLDADEEALLGMRMLATVDL